MAVKTDANSKLKLNLTQHSQNCDYYKIVITDHRNVYMWFVVRTTIAHEVSSCQVHDLADSILDSRLSLLRSRVLVEIDKLLYWTIGSRCLFFGDSWIHDHESFFPTIVSELEVGLEL